MEGCKTSRAEQNPGGIKLIYLSIRNADVTPPKPPHGDIGGVIIHSNRERSATATARRIAPLTPPIALTGFSAKWIAPAGAWLNAMSNPPGDCRRGKSFCVFPRASTRRSGSRPRFEKLLSTFARLLFRHTKQKRGRTLGINDTTKESNEEKPWEDHSKDLKPNKRNKIKILLHLGYIYDIMDLQITIGG